MNETKPATFRERVIRFLGGLSSREVKTIQRRAYEAGMEDGGDDEPVLYTADGKAITTGYKEVGNAPRDLSAISQEKAIDACYRLWQTHPLAKALVEIWVDYILGNGVTVKAENEDVQAALDKFWFDPVNKLGDTAGGIGEGLEELTRELWLFGERVVLTFERTGEDKGMIADGLVRLGSVDPTSIFSVICNPLNRKDEIGLRLKSETGGSDGPVYRIIRESETAGLMEGARDLVGYAMNQRISEGEQQPAAAAAHMVEGKEWRIDGNGAGVMQLSEAKEPISGVTPAGSCFYWRVNKISTGVRGRPELLPMIDWLDRFDQVFFDGAEHTALLNMFSWDLKIEGGSEISPDPETNLNVQAKKVAKLRPGSAYAHNEKVALEAINPELKTGELETLIRELRIFIAGGARVPEHWLAEGGYTNLATASAMGQPTFRMLSKKQGIIQRILTELCRYQIDVLVALGNLPRELPVLDKNGKDTGDLRAARKAFRVIMPDINAKDTNEAARTLASIAQAILPLIVGNIIPKQPALEVLREVFALLGVDLDVDKVLEDEQEGISKVDESVLDLLDRIGDRTERRVDDSGN